MDMNLEALLAFLPLKEREEVVADLLRRAKAASEGSFSLTGSSAGGNRCSVQGPHVPHWIGESYHTTRYGTVQYYCVGRNSSDLQIVFTTRYAGDASSLSNHEGYWRRIPVSALAIASKEK